MKVLILISAFLALALATPVKRAEPEIVDADYEDFLLTGALKQALFKNFIASVERDAMKAYNRPFSAYTLRKRAAPEMDMGDLADLFKAQRG